MKSRIPVLFCMILCFVQCREGSERQSREKACLEFSQKGAEMLNRFHFEKTPSYLDSALMYYDRAAAIDPTARNSTLYNKAHVYFYKEEYDNALRMLRQMPDSVFPFPQQRTIFIEKIEARQAAKGHDTLKRDLHYRNIVMHFDRFLETYRSAADSIMRSPDAEYISLTLYGWNLAERYYYSSKLCGNLRTFGQLDSLQKVSGYNPQYIQWIKDVLSGDENESMQIIFE